MLRKIGRIIVNALLIIYILAVVPLSVCGFFGIHPYAVVSGSMEPAISTGSMVFSKETSFKNLKKGDVITFMISEDQTVTHRIASVDEDKKKFTTKGDANDVEDSKSVSYENVIGKVIFHVPYLGYTMVMTGTKGRIILMAGIGLVLFSLCLLTETNTKNAKQEKTIEEKETDHVE